MLWRGKEKITILSFDYCILTGSIPYLAAYRCQPKSGITIYKCKWSVTLSTLNKTVRFFSPSRGRRRRNRRLLELNRNKETHLCYVTNCAQKDIWLFLLSSFPQGILRPTDGQQKGSHTIGRKWLESVLRTRRVQNV